MKVRSRTGWSVLRADGRTRAETVRDDNALRTERSDDDQDQDALDRAIPLARLAGLRVSLAVYPYPPREVEDGLATPEAFAIWLKLVAERYRASSSSSS